MHNPELHIATLNAKGKLEMELTVERGRGYVSATQNKQPGHSMTPLPSRLVTFLMASAPPSAATYFSMIESAVIGLAGCAGRTSGFAGMSVSSTGGMATRRFRSAMAGIAGDLCLAAERVLVDGHGHGDHLAGSLGMFAVASVLAEVIAERAEEADPAKAMGPMTPDRAVMLGLQIVTLLLDKKPQQEARHLNLRIERLLRGMMEVDEALGFIFEAKPRPEEKEYRQRTAEQLGNPLRSAAQIVNALREKQGEKIKGTGDWQGWGEGSEKNRAGCLGADERAQRGGMIRDLLQRKVAAVDLELLEGAEGKAAWMELWLRAFGIADETGNSKSEAGKSKAGDRVSSFDSRVSRVEVLAFAEMVWERIAMFRRQGEKERADVREALETAVLAKRAAAEEIADSKLPVAGLPRGRNSKLEIRNSPAGCRFKLRISRFGFGAIVNRQSAIVNFMVAAGRGGDAFGAANGHQVHASAVGGLPGPEWPVLPVAGEAVRAEREVRDVPSGVEGVGDGRRKPDHPGAAGLPHPGKRRQSRGRDRVAGRLWRTEAGRRAVGAGLVPALFVPGKRRGKAKMRNEK